MTTGASRRSTEDLDRVTIFHFAHPPPRSGSRWSRHGTPKLLLQLRREDSKHGAGPELEVYLAQPFLKQSRRQNLAVTGRGFVVKDDLLVAGCSSHDGPGFRSPAQGDENLRDRDIVSIIHRTDRSGSSAQEHISLAFNDGLLAGTKLEGGGYEFVAQDTARREVKVRWTRLSGAPESSRQAGSADDPLEFFLVDQSAQKQYVVGAMDPHNIVVMDSHKVSFGIGQSGEGQDGPQQIFNSPERSPPSAQDTWDGRDMVVDTSPQLQTLILVTGIWVAITEGWAPSIQEPKSEGKHALKMGENRRQGKNSLKRRDRLHTLIARCMH